MMRMVRKELVARLFLVLMDMLVYVVDDPCWGNAINDDENEGELIGALRLWNVGIPLWSADCWKLKVNIGCGLFLQLKDMGCVALSQGALSDAKRDNIVNASGLGGVFRKKDGIRILA
ncbi:hypothetical protein CQW23_22123 [Capsicum baccatum]|uniref:Uncharacterized protein n=1 Tax=Capsicum baccatum TaxID=33114 RepID=A0A2G2VZZ0_CAPBA|nr:hypothetical protein CQW23_22123 [Capsicum baccatum]